MRMFLTIGVKPNGRAEMLAGPEVPYAEQRKAVKDLQVKGVHPKFNSVELWASGGGRIIQARLQTAAQKEANEKRRAAKLEAAEKIMAAAKVAEATEAEAPDKGEPAPVPPTGGEGEGETGTGE